MNDSSSSSSEVSQNSQVPTHRSTFSPPPHIARYSNSAWTLREENYLLRLLRARDYVIDMSNAIDLVRESVDIAGTLSAWLGDRFQAEHVVVKIWQLNEHFQTIRWFTWMPGVTFNKRNNSIVCDDRYFANRIEVLFFTSVFCY